MKIFVITTVAALAVCASSNEEKWKVDWSTVVPITAVPGFWDGREVKSVFHLKENTRSGRIVGGQVVTPHSHTYQAALLIRLSLLTTALCGGSLITSASVLTAAHCMENSQSTQVILGAHDFTTIEPTQNRQIIEPANYRFHPDYKKETFENDIAILYLPIDINFNQFIQPVIFPLPIDRDDLFAGEFATVTGWGETSDSSPRYSPELRSAQNFVIPNSVCVATFGALITSSKLCMSTLGNRGSCKGDSGGPLTITRRGETILIGVASIFAAASCESGFPVVFTRITYHDSWIRSNWFP